MAACHDLRQPLQTLFLLQSLLAKCVDGYAARQLAEKLSVPLASMAEIVSQISGKTLPAIKAGEAAVQIELNTRLTADQPGSELPSGTIFVIDDDDELRAALRGVLEEDGNVVCDFATSEAFLAHGVSSGDGCLLLDAYLPGMSGLELLHHLNTLELSLPIIMITGRSDVPMAVQAMKAGAVGFIEKPVQRNELLECIERALSQSHDQNTLSAWQHDAAKLIAGLTPRQRQIMDPVLAGQPNKNIAADLGISQRTTENHRAAIMSRTGAKSLPALARLAVAAASVISTQTERAETRTPQR